ncbi:hypothetical protein ACFQT0_14025 [Hymenobacter humi]|uniref:Uncharacterized protein n=1 Tax=Hymenobacter humi TaxID=1411620 RepID=A0ABW2U6A0_9BACT
MSIILTAIDSALASHDARLGRPVAIYLGERKYTQLTLDAARSLLPDLSTDAGRPWPTATWSSCAMKWTWTACALSNKLFS